MDLLIVPVIDVHSENFKELWPAIVVAIKGSSFIALDTELSGLGNRKSLLAESIEDRYASIRNAARSRTILSLGIACYKKRDDKVMDTYLAQVYNLILLCSEEYVIEPQSVQFLVQHGFDFNRQYSHGIPYYKGNNKEGSDNRGVNIRALFTELLRARKPVVLHNGLIDLAFLYQCLYAYLPEKLATFTADLTEMFPAGVYDTKYITKFELDLDASYLEYAYKKCYLENSRCIASGAAGPHVYIEFCQYIGPMSLYVDYKECQAVTHHNEQTALCPHFSGFGWCPNGAKCLLSHDTDQIILQDEKNKEDKKKKRKRKKDKKQNNKGAGDGSIADGAPANKIPHLESDAPQESADQPQAPAESDLDYIPLSEGVENIKQEKETSDIPFLGEDGILKQDEEKNLDIHEDGNETHKDEADAEDYVTIPAEEMKLESVTRPSAVSEAAKKKAEGGTHRAGFDAYMTGYIFAYSCAFTTADESGEKKESCVSTCMNKIFLSSKAAPLNVVKSSFAKSSKAHVKKMAAVWGERK